MTLAALIRGKSESVKVATATLATVATLKGDERRTVANVATVSVANPPETKIESPEPAEPFDVEAWDERAAIAEFDGGLSRDDAEQLAWEEDDRRRCRACANLLPGDLCTVAHRYREAGPCIPIRKPVPDLLRRCDGYKAKLRLIQEKGE